MNPNELWISNESRKKGTEPTIRDEDGSDDEIIEIQRTTYKINQPSVTEPNKPNPKQGQSNLFISKIFTFKEDKAIIKAICSLGFKDKLHLDSSWKAIARTNVRYFIKHMLL